MINLKNVVQIENQFLTLRDSTEDLFVFQLQLFVNDDELINTKLTKLVVDLYAQTQRGFSYASLSDAIRNAKADSTKKQNPITSLLIDLSVGYDSNPKSKVELNYKILGEFNSYNKLLLGLADDVTLSKQVEKAEDVDIVIEQVSNDFRQLNFEFSVPKKSLTSPNIDFEFFLQSTNDLGNSVSERAQLNISALVSKLSKLTSKPKVEVFAHQSIIYAKIDTSNDSLVRGVSIFRKVKNKNFEKLADVTLDLYSSFLPIDVEHHYSSVTYRFVNFNSFGEESDSFVDVTLTSENIESPAIYGEQIIGGFRLFARSFPADVICARFLFKEMNNKSQQENTGAFLPIVSNFISADINTYLRPNAVYEVVLECIRSSGVTTILGKYVFRNIPKKNDGLSVSIDELNIDSTNGDVRFKVAYKIKKNDNDILKTLLTAIDSISLYSSDFEKIKDELEPVVTFQVIRVDLTDGTHSDLGILSEPIFSDQAQSQITGAPTLDLLKSYRYEIKPLIRFSETVLSKLQRTVKSGKKTYTFTPAKFVHPKSLETGTLFSEAGLRALFSQSEFEFGESSNITVLNVTFENQNLSLTPNLMTQVGNNEFAVTFNVDGNINILDHYEIFLETTTGNLLIDKKFSSSPNVFFTVKLDNFQLNFKSIIIQPIFINGTLGVPIKFENTFKTSFRLNRLPAIVAKSGTKV